MHISNNSDVSKYIYEVRLAVLVGSYTIIKVVIVKNSLYQTVIKIGNF